MEVRISTSVRNFSRKTTILRELRASVELSAVVCVCFNATLPVVYVYIHDFYLKNVYSIILFLFNVEKLL